jgi:CRP/FNR family transcriptional regulator, cyclic AMP receptor protein
MSGPGLLSADAESSMPLEIIELFAGIDPAELDRVEHFMAPFRAEAGEVLFRQGEDGDRLFAIGSGQVEVHAELTGGRTQKLATVLAGESLGEMAVLGRARRSGTAAAASPVSGWLLHRSSLAMLRLDPAPGAVELVARLTELVLARLRVRYEAIAAELARDDRAGGATHAPDTGAAAAARHRSGPYLETLLCFRHFHDHGQIERALDGAEAVELPAGAVALAPAQHVQELLLVVRGALDVSIRGSHSARRVRLAGPGRFVGHVGALDAGSSPVVAHARDPVVLVRLDAARVRAMLRDPLLTSRRFAAGVAEDIARALRQAERPIAQMQTEPAALQTRPTPKRTTPDDAV